MRYKTQSAIVGRSGKRDEFGNGPVFIHLFSKNDPHKSAAVPDKFIDGHMKIHKIIFRGLDLNFLLAGSDILINDLEYIDVEEDKKSKGNLIITGKHKA
jgi:Ca2+-binding RTX toxin-like protein